MPDGTEGSAPAREYEGDDKGQVPVPDDGGTPPAEGQVPAHDPQDEPAESDTAEESG